MAVIQAWLPGAGTELALHHLVAGQCVVLPTESTYEVVASGLHETGISRLRDIASGDQIPAVVLCEYPNLFDWLPLLRGAGSRLFRKMGPGPLTLAAESGYKFGLWQKLCEPARRLVVRDGRLAVRWPVHPVWEELRRVNVPLVSTPLGAESAAHAAGLGVACVIDSGPTQFRALPAHVESDGQRCEIIRTGSLKREQIDSLALCRILFICTGNTCRSPMAEVLCAKMLADRLGCLPSELAQNGYLVQSAGLAAMNGSDASPEAVRVVAEMGADLSHHRSRPASMEMVSWADFIFTMTASHVYALMQVPDIPEPRLLSPRGDDVSDPIGGAQEDYRTCAEQIIQCLQQRLPELLEA